MYKVKRGNIKAVLYSQKDVDNYIAAGWKIDDGSEEVKAKEEPKEEIKEETAKVEEITEEPKETFTKKTSYKKR